MTTGKKVQTWSTEAVPQPNRLDFWMSTLNTALWPVTQWSGVARNFGVQLREAPLACLSSMSLSISSHDSHRIPRDISRSQEECYLLISNRKSAWGSTHNGHCERLEPNDIVLWADSELKTYIPNSLDGAILKCPAHWLRTWLPDPDLLVGRRIDRNSTWGRVLSPVLGQLTPDIALAPPLPSEVLTDQVGAVLALIAGEVQAGLKPALRQQVLRCIRERCCEPDLTAADVAATLNLPARLVHDSLADGNRTFAAALLDARIEVAKDLIGSRDLDQVDIPGTALRAGFLDSDHFVRVLRKRVRHLRPAV